MKRLYFAWLILVATLSLYLFVHRLDSDSLLLDNVMTDLFRYGGRWKDWKFPPAPAFFPDMLAYAAAHLLLPTVVARLAFVNLVQAVLLGWMSLRMAALIRPSLSVNAKTFIVLLLAATTLVGTRSNMWFYFSSTNNHFASLLLSLFCAACALCFVESGRRSFLAWMAAGIALGEASTPVFVLAFTLPALVFALTCVRLLHRDDSRRRFALKAGAWVICGHILGWALIRLLINYGSLTERASHSIKGAVNSLRMFWAATQLTFSPDNLYGFVLAVFLAGCIAWLLIDWFLRHGVARVSASRHATAADATDPSSGGWRHDLGVTFLLFVIPVNLVGAVVSGGIADVFAYRYFMFPIVLGMLLWITMSDARGVFDSSPARAGVPAFAVALLALEAVQIKPVMNESGRSGFNEILVRSKVNPVDSVSDCVNGVIARGFPARAGIADFWYARGVAYRLDKPLYILPVQENGQPLFHMMTLGPILAPGRYGADYYNFAILHHDGTPGKLEFAPKKFGRLLPPPTEVVNCDRSDAELWLYTSPALTEFVNGQLDQFLFKLQGFGHYDEAAFRLQGDVGRIEGTARIASEGSEGAGYLSYGPYIGLPAGRYRATLTFSSTGTDNRWDVGRYKKPGWRKLAYGVLPKIENGKSDFIFTVEKNTTDIEFRVYFSGHGILKLDRLEIKRDTAAPSADGIMTAAQAS